MPSGRIHDIVTLILTVPASIGAFIWFREAWPATVVGAAFLFGGMVFGPDLDTKSKQYSRWGIFRFLWMPYRMFFKHRSRFTHGLLFGSLFRVIYFIGVVTLLMYVISLAWTGISDDSVPDIRNFARAWQMIAELANKYLGEDFLILSFVGLWLGAASHTFSDMAITYIKTGKVERMF
ncbi:MAG TPA: metal-binding protein [Pyrinomonadaceae bacterium]|nr:metal-binding protein [Pyrinomonadaceae bacterium]